jgi:hypothetical protein
MKTLVSTAEVLKRAFKSHEKLPHDTIREADVEAVEWRRLRPVLGAALHDRLLQGDDVAFVQAYLADAIALLTRAEVLPRMAHFCSAVGAFRPSPADTTPTDNETLLLDVRTAKRHATTLLRRAVAYIEAHATDYPEYDPAQNILNRCTTDGGFVQTF